MKNLFLALTVLLLPTTVLAQSLSNSSGRVIDDTGMGHRISELQFRNSGVTSFGTVTVNSGTTVGVSLSTVNENALVLLSPRIISGTVTTPARVGLVSATIGGFRVESSAGDVSVYNWLLIRTIP